VAHLARELDDGLQEGRGFDGLGHAYVEALDEGARPVFVANKGREGDGRDVLLGFGVRACERAG